MLPIKTILFPEGADRILIRSLLSRNNHQSFLETAESSPVPPSTLSRYFYTQEYSRHKMMPTCLAAGMAARRGSALWSTASDAATMEASMCGKSA